MNHSAVKNYLGQADPTRDLVRDIFPVYMSYPGTGDVFHPTATHPDLQKHTHTHAKSVWKSVAILWNCVAILNQNGKAVPIIRNLLVLEKNNPNPSCCTILYKTYRRGKNGRNRMEEKEDLQSNAGWKMGFCSQDNNSVKVKKMKTQEVKMEREQWMDWL